MTAREKSAVSAHSLTVKYIIGLILIALLSLASYYIIAHLITAEQASAAIINLGGRQRMLSQRTALLSLQLADATDPVQAANVRSELARTVATMEMVHEGLVHGSPKLGLPGSLSPEAAVLMFDKPVMLDSKLKDYWAEAKALIQDPDSSLSDRNPHVLKITAMSDTIVDALIVLVDQFQRESEARMARLKALQAAVLFAMIVVLLLEALFIFQPAVLTIRRETDKLAAANLELQRISNSDGLTGIANRRLFEDFLGREWQRAGRQREPLTLIMIDVDHFKSYNDTFGHQAGDECLRRLAEVLRANVKRTTDLVARYGGEEFAAVLPDTDAAGAAGVAEQLRAAVEALAIPHTASPVSQVVTVSLGTATVFPGPGDSPADIVAMADQAMYQAKQQGRNRAIQAVVANGPKKGRKGNG